MTVNCRMWRLAAGLLVAMPVWAQETMETRYGYVVDKREIAGDSSVTKGAIIGGVVGLVTASGKSGGTKLKRTAGGALLGGVIANQVDKSKRHYRYTIAFPDGQETQIEIQDERLAFGDCAAIRSSRSQVTVDYSSDYFCEREEQELQASQPVVEVVEPAPNDTCAEAKQRLLDEEDESQVAILIEKVKVICDQP